MTTISSLKIWFSCDGFLGKNFKKGHGMGKAKTAINTFPFVQVFLE